MKPFTMYKIIGGKRWSYASYGDTKAEASGLARHIRSLGYNVRVTKEKSPMGKIYYPIWQRKK